VGDLVLPAVAAARDRGARAALSLARYGGAADGFGLDRIRRARAGIADSPKGNWLMILDRTLPLTQFRNQLIDLSLNRADFRFQLGQRLQSLLHTLQFGGWRLRLLRESGRGKEKEKNEGDQTHNAAYVESVAAAGFFLTLFQKQPAQRVLRLPRLPVSPCKLSALRHSMRTIPPVTSLRT
jgi:hypothetical protein